MIIMYILGLEILIILIFMFYSNGVVLIMILISFVAMIYIDGIFMLLSLISWPILLLLVVLMSICVNGIRVLNYANFMYIVVMSMITPVLLYLYLLVLVLMGLVIIMLLGSYISYWSVCVNIISMILIVYCFMDVNLVWLGILPLLLFFQNQNIVIVFFMLNVIWFY